VITLAVALIFAVDTIAKFVNFGALTAFMTLNLSVFIYFFIKRGRRGSLWDFLKYLLFPLIGFAIIAYVWSGFDTGTFIFGFSWLAVGVIVGAVKTRGFTRKPLVLEEL